MYMVSMCCGDCRTEKLKSNLFNNILLNEHCKNISEYLGCDDCIKLNAIMNDPIYKTLDLEQQQIYKVVKLFKFPEYEELKNIFQNYPENNKSIPHLKDITNRIFKYKRNYSIINEFYNNLFLDDAYEDYILNKKYLVITSDCDIISFEDILPTIIVYILHHYNDNETKYNEYVSHFCNIDGFYEHYDFIRMLVRRIKEQREED